eukprot:12360770-Heterocapsa_arctica.AAC.1
MVMMRIMMMREDVRAWRRAPEPRQGQRWTSTWRRHSPTGPGARTASCAAATTGSTSCRTRKKLQRGGR